MSAAGASGPAGPGTGGAGQGVAFRSLRDLAAIRDFVPSEPAPAPQADTSLPRAVFAWLVERVAARRRQNLPISKASLRADLALGFAAHVGEAAVWPEALYGEENGPRLHLLVHQPEPRQRIAVAVGYPRRAGPGQPSLAPRQLGDLLRDSLRLARAFPEPDDLPLQLLLCTDEFRSHLAGPRPSLRLLRADAVDTAVALTVPLADLDDATLTRLADAVTERHTRLRLAFDVLGYAPVGPLHLGLWRVLEARVE